MGTRGKAVSNQVKPKKIESDSYTELLTRFFVVVCLVFCLFVLGVSGVIELPLTEMRRLFIEKKFGG